MRAPQATKIAIFILFDVAKHDIFPSSDVELINYWSENKPIVIMSVVMPHQFLAAVQELLLLYLTQYLIKYTRISQKGINLVCSFGKSA